MNKILCIQISTELINGKPNLKDISQRYYDTLYKLKEKQGYYKGKHFWECPQWVTEIDFNTPVDFYICTDIKATVNHLLTHNYKYVCFSVLEVNKKIINNIILGYFKECGPKYETSNFILGGYIDFDYFHKQKHIKFNKNYFWDVLSLTTIKAFIEHLGLTYTQGYDYRLFKGFKTIPRLTLSTGCLHNCDFCTIENKITRTPIHIIEQQIKAFKPLVFKLVYINDKTFSQCNNYKILPRIYKAIKEYNKDFEGFIIQTTTTAFNKLNNSFIHDAHIKYVELGIETFNDSILRQYHKPSSEKTIMQSYFKMKELNGVKLIPNIIIGMPEETQDTYLKTWLYLLKTSDVISHFNIYNLAVYENTELSKRIKPSKDNNNELTVDTSKQIHISFYNKIHQLGIDMLRSFA